MVDNAAGGIEKGGEARILCSELWVRGIWIMDMKCLNDMIESEFLLYILFTHRNKLLLDTQLNPQLIFIKNFLLRLTSI